MSLDGLPGSPQHDWASPSESSRFMNFDTIAKWVAHKEALPRGGAAIVNLHACGLQPGSQAIHVCTLKAEVPLGIRSTTRLLDREVKIKSTGIKPDAASGSQRLRFGNLSEPKVSPVERTGHVLAALRHGHVDV